MRATAATSVLTCLVCLILAGCSSNPSAPSEPEPGITILVDLSGNGDYVTLADGINAATDGDTVLVAPGTYTGEENRNLDLSGMAIVIIGIAGSDSTIIDCGGEDRGLRVDNSARGNCVIEGLTVMDGFTTGRGAGMHCVSASPVLVDVVFRGNTAGTQGGGLYLRDASPTLESVMFDDNVAFEGGGLHCDNSSPALVNVTFTRNIASSGGAVFCLWSSPAMADVEFLENSAGSGGGIACIFSSPTVASGIFWRNMGQNGAGIYCGGSSPSIASCTFAENLGTVGGGISCFDGSTPAVAQTVIAFSEQGKPIACSGSNPSSSRLCVYANAGGDSLCGSFSDTINQDPLFCDLEGGDLSLQSGSPCLPENNPWGVLIGALGEGCDGPR